MTRQEQAERKEANYQAKKRRVLTTLQVFVENDGEITDDLLAETVIFFGVETSGSTVGRDLTVNLEKIFLEENRRKEMEAHYGESSSQEHLDGSTLTQEQISIIAFVKKKRQENKKNGNSKGGRTAIRNNDVKKDKEGKFDGCRKRH